jgi:hypothetical protein
MLMQRFSSNGFVMYVSLPLYACARKPISSLSILS